MRRELEGRAALVTGAASGIGAACAAALAEAGADVRGIDRDDCDIADAKAVASLFESYTPDVVINSAGIVVESGIAELSVEDFDRVIAVNLRGTFLLAKYALPRMRENGGGRFIAVASELAYLGRADYSAYCASKAGVIGLVRALAREFAPDVLVNTLAPGPVDTPMLDIGNMSPEVVEKESDIPLGRVGRPEEIAAVARFLAGPDASFMTGQTVSPNGGAVMI